MENTINEGQTQVYTDGHIDGQPGVNTNAPYLNQPRQQLMDIIHVLFNQSGRMSDIDNDGKIDHSGSMTDQQVMTILVGMGIPQQMAMSGIAQYRQMHKDKSNIYTENTNQKNQNKMNFTLTDLYEKVMESINGLKAMDNDNSRVSYSVKESLTVLEEAITAFPMKLKNADLSLVSEEIEKAANPNLKFKIARDLYSRLSQNTWLNPISELREYIMESYNNSKWHFRISESIERTASQKGKLMESFNADLTSLLNESDVKSKFSVVAAKHPWSMDAKAIVNEMNAEDQKIASTANGKVVSILSPVLESEEGLTFHLHGKNYTYNGTDITEANVTDPRFFDITEGLAMFSRNENILSLHGENNKSLEYNITEGTLTMGKVDMTNYSIIELKEALLATNFSGYRNQWQNDKICKFFESVDLLAEMDNFTTIQNPEFLDVFLTMIGVSEGIYINKVNPGMNLNEMSKINTATETVEIVKEFINFDVSPILSERLIAEDNEKAIEENKRKDLTDSISFLEEKKSEVEAAIKKLGETEELTEALNLLEEELKGKEKELADSYISEKKTKDDYLNDGYVEASMKVNSQGLKKRQEVLVSAEEYASLGDDDMLSVIVPKNGKSVVMPKGDLEVKI
tara:strand:+ start:9897 stop:11780 length:1884 start_codon:yes stop_codon:yes gene_type:complete